MTPLEHALALAGKGVHVFWVQGSGDDAKKPYEGTRGFKDATTDPAKIRAGLKRWPDSLLAVRTGPASMITMVDFDGELGESYRLSRNDWGSPRIHKTRRGHHYVYFTARRAFATTQSIFAPKVDTRGEGGYMVWWPAHGFGVERETAGRMPLSVRNLFPKKSEANLTAEDAPEKLSAEEFDRLKACLYARDPGCSEWDWTQCIWAVRHVTRRSQAGFDLLKAWSSEAKNYNLAELTLKWRREDRQGSLITGRYLGWEKDIEFSELPETDDEVVTQQKPQVVGKDLPELRRKKNGRIEPNYLNIHNAIAKPDFCGMHIGYDKFRAEFMQSHGAAADRSQMTPFGDNHYGQLRRALEQRGFDSTRVTDVRQAVAEVGMRHTFDSAVDWLEALQHDGVPRVATFLRDYFGADDSEYSRAVSVYLWTALAARVLDPGCQADMAVIMVSSQGERKSTGISALCPRPEQFVELNLDESDDDLARKMSGCLIGELAELRGLMTRDLESIKSFITRKHEKWVPKYKEFAHTYPRRLIFIGTTNKREFLADETGERRFLPVDVLQAKPEAIQRDRDQLWAEGRDLYQIIGIAWQRAEQLGRKAVHEYKVGDVWDEAIDVWLTKGDGFNESSDACEFTTADVATGALGIDARHVDRRTEMRISKVLHGLGFEKKVAKKNGRPIRLWRRLQPQSARL